MVRLRLRMGSFGGVLCLRVSQGEILKLNVPLVTGQTGVYPTDH